MFKFASSINRRLCTKTLIPPKQIPAQDNANERAGKSENVAHMLSMPVVISKNKDNIAAILSGRIKIKSAETILNRQTVPQMESMANTADDMAEESEMDLFWTILCALTVA